MSRRDIIRILVVLVGLFWLTLLVMPRRYAVVDDLNARFYDKEMASREFMIRKELKSLSENKQVSEEIKLDTQETLAKILWATFRAQDAAAMLRDVETEREKLNKNYNQKTINTMLVLAGVYRDLDQLNDSAFWYRKVGHLDLVNLPADDVRLMRDEINFAVLDYLCGDIETDQAKRQQRFKDTLAHAQRAMEIWHKQKSPDTATLANLLYVQYLAYRDLGNVPASRQAFAQMKYLNRQLKRPYKLPWK